MSDSTAPDPNQAAQDEQARSAIEVPQGSETNDLDPEALPTDGLGAGAADAEAALEKIAQAEREARKAELLKNRESSALETYFARLHPLGWVALGFMLVAGVATILGSDLLIGNMPIWLWAAAASTVIISALPKVLHLCRVVFEKISDGAGLLAKILVWVVFILQFINVVTRYANGWFEQDILFGQVASGSIHGFAFVFMLGIGYAVKDQVNPRIDFWWGEFSQLRKAKLDFVMHTFFFLPFLVVAIRALKPYSARALGYKPSSGTWPEGWAVWRTWEGPKAAGELPLGYLKGFLLVAFILWTIQILAEIIKNGFVLAGREDLADIKVSDVPLRIE